MDAILEQAWTLKQSLIDFVLDAEGELAEALETYAATQSSKRNISQDLVVDLFLVEGKIGDKTPLDLFTESEPGLSESDRHLLTQWHHTFTGLFAVEQVFPEGFELMNWLTAKRYRVKPGSEKAAVEMQPRLKPGEILLTRIAPLTDTEWMASSSYTFLGNLGKPKLAVAIGNFKENHKRSLYSDAPELLEQAWQSVEKYHQAFLDFFGSDEVTLPGYKLNSKMAEFREILTQRQLAEAGIDPSKSLEELAAEADIDEAEMVAAAEEAGIDPKEAAKAIKTLQSNQMAAPQVQLPDSLKKAEQVTVLAHPRWGQTFLTTYSKLKTLLETGDEQEAIAAEKLVRQYLADPTINISVWQRLAQEYPQPLEKLLQTVSGRPDFSLETNLESLLQEHGKSLEPELPEIASVPIHLHSLFEEAVTEVNKSKSKSKSKPKKTGFG